MTMDNKSVSEFLFENDAPEILLNNLRAYNNRPEDINNLISEIITYGTKALQQYIEPLKISLTSFKQKGIFPNIDELNSMNFNIRIATRSEKCVDEAYAEIVSILKEEKQVNNLRMALRSKNENRVLEFAKTLMNIKSPSIIDIKKVLDIKTLRQEGRKNNLFIKTGLELLDNAIYGFQNKTINTISAPSSGGKTTVAVNIAYNNAVNGKIVVYCALESSAEEITSLFMSTSYKHKLLLNPTFLEDKFSNYNNNEKRLEFKAGTVNSIQFYKISEEMDNLLIENYKQEITKNGGQIYVIDNNICNLDSVNSLIDVLESIAENEGRRVDMVIIDNADHLTSFKTEDKYDSDMTLVNKMINSLNAYATTHYNGLGTTFLFLAQLNREGIKEHTKQTPIINLTHISTYSNLYTKANVVITLAKSPKFQHALELRILKNRHGKTSEKECPIYIHTLFEYCYIDNDNTKLEEKNSSDIKCNINYDDDISDIVLEDDEFENSALMS